MKTLELKNFKSSETFKVTELSQKEKQELQGGLLFTLAMAAVAVLYLAGTMAGLASGYNPHTMEPK